MSEQIFSLDEEEVDNIPTENTLDNQQKGIKYMFDSQKHIFKINTKDEKILMVDPSVFPLSPYFSAIQMDESTNEVQIPLNYNVLYLVFEYMDYIFVNPTKKIPNPIMDLTLKEYVSQPELDWVNTVLETKGLLVDLIYAANYLHVQPLLELCAAKIASLLKAKKTKEERIIVANNI
jgi:hypothetical protein